MFMIYGRLLYLVVDIHGCRGIPYLKQETGVRYSSKVMSERRADISTSFTLPRRQPPGAVLLDEECKGLQGSTARPIFVALR
jgi:hypothetical protein